MMIKFYLFDNEEYIANALLGGKNVYEIKGVADAEDAAELNAFIIVMKSGKRYCVEVTECEEGLNKH